MVSTKTLLLKHDYRRQGKPHTLESDFRAQLSERSTDQHETQSLGPMSFFLRSVNSKAISVSCCEGLSLADQHTQHGLSTDRAVLLLSQGGLGILLSNELGKMAMR